MEKMHDLKDLLKHEILDLVSAEEQIIAALPAMIQKAGNPTLKEALSKHLQVTEQQRARLDRVQQLMSEGEAPAAENENGEPEKKRGFIAGLFRRNKDEKQVCLGTKGLIEEGEKVMGENMEPEVMDAAIIGCAQKIEHYEICGYGTAKAYARELNLPEVERLLEQTLNEEYEADDQLTALAVGRLNKKAEQASPENNPSSNKERKGAAESRVTISPRPSVTGNGAKQAGKGAPAKVASKVAGAKSARPNTGESIPAKRATAVSNISTSSKASIKTAPNKSAAKTSASKSSSKQAPQKGNASVKRK